MGFVGRNCSVSRSLYYLRRNVRTRNAADRKPRNGTPEKTSLIHTPEVQIDPRPRGFGEDRRTGRGCEEAQETGGLNGSDFTICGRGGDLLRGADRARLSSPQLRHGRDRACVFGCLADCSDPDPRGQAGHADRRLYGLGHVAEPAKYMQCRNISNALCQLIGVSGTLRALSPHQESAISARGSNMTKRQIEAVWVPEPSLSAFGVNAVGWWALGDDGVCHEIGGPYSSLDECVSIALALGYMVPADQMPG